MPRINPLFVFLCIVIFLIPFYRVQLQYDFRFYVGMAYFLYVVSTNNLFITTDSKLNFKSYAAFYGWVAFTAFFTVNANYSVQYLINYFFLSLFFLLVIHYVNSYRRLIIVSRVLVASLALQLFIVFMQYMGVKAFYMNDVENLGLNTGMTEASTGIVRFWGSFGEVLVLSTYLTTLGIGLMVYLISVHKRNWLTYIALGAILFGIYLTGSRAGMSIFILVFGTFLIRARVFSRPIFAVAVLLSGLAGYYYFDLVIQSDANLARFSQLQEGDIRFQLWTKGFAIVLDNPLVGSTIGCLNYSLKTYHLLPDYASNVNASGHVENTYLTILFSTGIIGFIFFIGMVQYPFRLIRKYKLRVSPDTMPYRIILRVYRYGYIALLSCMLAEPSVGVYMRSTMLFMLMNGLICCLVNIYLIEQGGQTRRPQIIRVQPSTEMYNLTH